MRRPRRVGQKKISLEAENSADYQNYLAQADSKRELFEAREWDMAARHKDEGKA